MELREKIAREIVLFLGGDPDQKIPDGSCAKVWEANVDRADRILNIPEIKEALDAASAAARMVACRRTGYDPRDTA